VKIQLAYGDAISAEQWFGDRSKALIALHGSAANVANPHLTLDADQLDALIELLTQIRACIQRSARA
jgi:hypothetical protein